MAAPPPPPTLVLVHGAWHGSWAWDSVVPHLDAAGVDHRAVELPLTGHLDDVAATRALLDDIDGPKVLVGHSYGGVVISGVAAGRDDVTHLVYVCALLLAEGASAREELAAVPDLPRVALADALGLNDDGTTSIDPAGAVVAFYGHSPADAAAAAIERLRPMEAGSLDHPALAEPWRTIPTTYVVCEQDQAIPVEFQRAVARRAGEVVALDTDHSPFLSMPEATARILVAAAAPVSGSR